MSLGANRLASSTTWVDSAFWGSQAEESFCWALLSLPASGPATANTTIQKTRPPHLVQRPAGRLAIPRTRSMTTPSTRHPSHGQSRYISIPSWSTEILMTAISRPPNPRRGPSGLGGGLSHPVEAECVQGQGGGRGQQQANGPTKQPVQAPAECRGGGGLQHRPTTPSGPTVPPWGAWVCAPR